MLLFQHVDINHSGLLSLMRMLAAVVDVHILEQLGAQAVLGKHTLDSLKEQRVHARLDVLVVRFLHQLLGRGEALATGITRVADILLLSPLLAGHDDLVGVDDNNIVTAIHVRREIRFVLSAQDLRDLGAQASQNLVGSIDYYPLFLYGFGVSRDGFVT